MISSPRKVGMGDKLMNDSDVQLHDVTIPHSLCIILKMLHEPSPCNDLGVQIIWPEELDRAIIRSAAYPRSLCYLFIETTTGRSEERR